jgi:hypothetical protein
LRRACRSAERCKQQRQRWQNELLCHFGVLLEVHKDFRLRVAGEIPPPAMPRCSRTRAKPHFVIKQRKCSNRARPNRSCGTTMVEVCYDRMTEILSCREFSKGGECRSVENANFISRKTLHTLPKVVVDVSRWRMADLREKSASAR